MKHATTLLFTFVLTFAVSAVAEGPVVTLDSGKVRGETLDSGMDVFRGIPFAAPPVGDLRWKEPQPVTAWDGVRDATAFGKVAPQSPEVAIMSGEKALPESSEDCLYLNVWSTAVGDDANLPVMVWIHGGGLTMGYSNQGIYDGRKFAERDVVLVSINYRLGAFGYFAHPLLTAESPNQSSGNYGLLDQIAALKWVQRNIAYFGGDPGNVTIFGESAGGTNVYALCASPMSKGLFHRAIAESPWVVESNFVPLRASGVESRESIGLELALQWLGEDAKVSLAALRALPTEEVFAQTVENYVPAVAIDDWFMPDFPERIFQRAEQMDVPLIAGTNRDEGTMFANFFPLPTLDEYPARMSERYGAFAGRILETYPVTAEEDVRGQTIQQVADVWFIRPTRTMVRAYASLGSKAYLYRFTRVGHTLPMLGAHHAAELPYVFGTLVETRAKDRDHALSNELMTYWIQFAKTGDPNGNGLPEWPAYSAEMDVHLEIGDSISLESGLREAACDLLDEVYEAYMLRAVAGMQRNTDD